MDRTLQCVALAGRSFLLDHRELDRGTERLAAGRFGTAFDQPFDAGLGKILLPAPNRGLRDPDLAHDRHHAIAVRRHDDDPRPFGDLLRGVSIGEQPLQFAASLPIKYDPCWFLSHPTCESYLYPNRIQMFVTEH